MVALPSPSHFLEFGFHGFCFWPVLCVSSVAITGLFGLPRCRFLFPNFLHNCHASYMLRWLSLGTRSIRMCVSSTLSAGPTSLSLSPHLALGIPLVKVLLLWLLWQLIIHCWFPVTWSYWLHFALQSRSCVLAQWCSWALQNLSATAMVSSRWVTPLTMMCFQSSFPIMLVTWNQNMCTILWGSAFSI